MTRPEHVASADAYDLLFCNGASPPARLARRLAAGAARVIGADGGADRALALGIVPGFVVGDFDSITATAASRVARGGGTLVRDVSQDDTDLEKALRHLRDGAAPRLAILGAAGGSFDHALGNLSVLARWASRVAPTLFDRDWRIDVVVSGRTYRCRPGDRISIVPLPIASGIRTEGLAYALSGETLEIGRREGTCNSAHDAVFHIAFDAGVLAVFRPLHRRVWDLEA